MKRSRVHSVDNDPAHAADCGHVFAILLRLLSACAGNVGIGHAVLSLGCEELIFDEYGGFARVPVKAVSSADWDVCAGPGVGFHLILQIRVPPGCLRRVNFPPL